jgi:hexosaminidase
VQEGSLSHTATFLIINRGQTPLSGAGWALYWNQAPRPIQSSQGPAKVENINGDFYRLLPGADFSLAPGDTARVSYTSGGVLIKVSDAPLGLYLAYQVEGEERTLPIARYTVLPFETEAQYRRGPNDQTPFPSAAWLYQQYERIQTPPEEGAYPFIPAPKSWSWGTGSYALPAQLSIAAAPELEAEARYLASALQERFQISAAVSTAADAGEALRLKLAPSSGQPESYQLEADAAAGITIIGTDQAGLFYGIQSLLSLARPGEGGGAAVPACSIQDGPAFAYRGLHVDVCRNFQSKETILRLLDLMARYKLNKLLFYLTEDEGWRLEIKGLPELTEVGGRRGHQHRDSLYLQPSYGSGPDPDDPLSHGNGYYTRADYQEILRYAQQRHIELIPQVNLPGHARAAIKAMELRYRRLMAAGQPEEAARYRLIDPDDRSKYLSAQAYFDNITSVCQEPVYAFFEMVLDEIIAMHQEAGVPLKTFHTGGDEVPATAWTESPACQAFMQQHPDLQNTRNLQGVFFARIVELLRQRGLRTGAWEEAVMVFEADGQWHPNPDYTDKEVYPYIWNSLWGNQDLGYRLANGGYPVVLCNVSNFYFDLAYNKDPREPGLYWGGFVETEDAFSFVPFDLFQSSRHDEMGRPLDPAKDFAGMERLSPAGRANILGLQGQLWGETIKGRDMLEYYYLPRLLGLSQRAWQGQPAWSNQGEAARRQDWRRFMHTLARIELPHLDTYRGGYAYRIPPPGILIENGLVHMNPGYPGFAIRYTTDGSEPTLDSPRYEGPFEHDGGLIKAASFDPRGRAGLSSSSE